MATDAVQDKVEEPDPLVIVDGFKVQDSPVLGAVDTLRATVPVKLPEDVRVIVDVAVCVLRMAAFVGFAVSEKLPDVMW